MTDRIIVIRNVTTPGGANGFSAVEEFDLWQEVFSSIFYKGDVRPEVVEVIARTGPKVEVFAATDLAPVAQRSHRWADIGENWRTALP